MWPQKPGIFSCITVGRGPGPPKTTLVLIESHLSVKKQVLVGLDFLCISIALLYLNHTLAAKCDWEPPVPLHNYLYGLLKARGDILYAYRELR